MRALIKLCNKINVITPIYIAKLGFKVRLTNVGAQKIDDFIFETFKIVLTKFKIEDK